MKTEIIVALIGVSGLIVTAAIGAIVSIIATKKVEHSSKASITNTPETVNTTPQTDYIENLANFFEDVSDEDPAKVEIAVNDDGRILMFYNHAFKVHLKRLEFFSQDRRLVFISDGEKVRNFGMALDESVAKHLKDVDKILLVKLNEKTKDMTETGSLPLKIYY